MSNLQTAGWEQARHDADLTLWLNETTPLFFRFIGAGSFRMGARGEQSNAEPQHLVRITRPFFLGTFPVTQAQWRAVVEHFPDSNLETDPSHFKGASLPVERVSWNDVIAWCDLAVNSGLLRGLTTADGSAVMVSRFGLPTEAQWEYACRAGTETEYYTGDGAAALAEAGWFDDNSDNQTHPAGELAPNSFGLYDMHGNVAEWCRDAWDADAYKRRIDRAPDPEVLAGDAGDEKSDRVIRGGSWYFSAWLCRSAIRFGFWPVDRYWYQGFRVCLVPGPVPQKQSSGTESSLATGDGARRDDERSRKERAKTE